MKKHFKCFSCSWRKDDPQRSRKVSHTKIVCWRIA